MNLQTAFLNVAARLPDDAGIKARLNRAYDIVISYGRGYDIKEGLEPRVYTVHKASTSLFADTSATYTVTNISCTCPDFPTARGGLCKHRLAIMLVEELTADTQCVYEGCQNPQESTIMVGYCEHHAFVMWWELKEGIGWDTSTDKDK